MIRKSLLLGAALAVTATPVLAQDFLGRLGRAAAERAAAGAISRAVSGAAPTPTSPATGPHSVEPRAAAPSARQSTTSAFAAPAPINYRPGMDSIRALEFSPEDAEGPQRLTQFSKYPCNDCEGGYAFGSWVGHYVGSLWGDNVLARRLGGMSVGEKIDWQVPQMRGSGRIEVVGERPVGNWPCKQVRWTITRPEGSAERMGLVCQGPYGAGTDWVEAL